VTSESDPVHENNPTPDTERESSKQPKHPEIPVPPTPTPKPECQPTKHHCEITCKTEKNWWDKAKPYVESAGIVLLAVYTFFTILMYCANKKAADAAKSAADTAASQLEFTQNSFREEQRAWIGVPDIKIVSLPSPAKMNVIFHNSGRTPALHLRGASAYAISSTFMDGPNPKYIAQLEKELATKGYTAIAPDGGGTLEAGDRDGYVSKQWRNIRGGTEFLYLYGVFRYNDTAGRPHATTYCYYSRDSNPSTQQLAAYNKYNDMD
jgi:hypothetical protein